MGGRPIRAGTPGEAAAVVALQDDGWKVTQWDTKGRGSTDIEAEQGDAKILVQVKSATSPREPAGLSTDELRDLKSRASRVRRTAWLAQVLFADNGDLLRVKFTVV